MTMLSFFIKQKTVKRLTWPARILILVLVLVLVFLTRHFWLTGIGRFLIVEHKIGPADIIVVEGGGDKDRILEAVRLYQKKYAGRILISGHTVERLPNMTITQEELAKKEAISRGVAPADIIIEGKSESTYEGALLSRSFFKRFKVKKAIIVSEPYHLRRSYLVYRKVYTSNKLTIICHAPPQSRYKANDWWQSENGLIDTSNEYIKLAYYLFKGYI